MSTDPSTTSPDPAAQATPATDALSSPVPAPDPVTSPAPPSPSDAAPAPSDPAPALSSGSLAILSTENADGFLIETPCLVLDTFEHDDAEGNQATFANVVPLPPALAVKVDRLSSPS